MESGRSISEDDVMSKLKDDGDFDRLRLKIIRHLKDNEELRNSIIATVKQSAALTHPGAENMKPRQLSDAIHEEVGQKLMGQISDSLWEIIRSPEGMKNEITETVASVYNKLSNPGGHVNDVPSATNAITTVQQQAANSETQTGSPCEVEDLSDSEPPGFSLSNHNQSYNLKKPKEEPDLDSNYSAATVEEQSREPCQANPAIEPNTGERGPPGLSATGESKQPFDGDDDPDVPPGFG